MKTKKLSLVVQLNIRMKQKQFMRRHAKKFAEHPAAKHFADNLWYSWSAFHKFYANEHATVDQLPVTLVLGLAGSGKSAFLNASKQILPQSLQLNAGSKPLAGFAMPYFAFSEQQLWVELPEYLWFGEGPYLEVLLDFWRAINFFDKIQQIVFTASLSQLLTPRDHSLLFKNTLWQGLSLLVSHLSKQNILVQVIVPEIDRLQGFVEFFGDLSLEERQHTFGLTVYHQHDWLSQARQKFQMLKNRLHNRMWWRCQSEHIHNRRLLVAEFPEQFGQLQLPLLRLLKYLRELQKVQPALAIKGCFFVSNFQHGNLFDVLAQQMPFQLSQQAQTLPMIPQRKTYFVRGCWQQLTQAINKQKPQKLKPSTQISFSLPWRKMLLGSLITVFIAVIAAVGYGQWSWWRIKHDLNGNGALAYRLMTSAQEDSSYKAFIAYELPYLPNLLQAKISQSAALHTQVENVGLHYINQQWNTQVYRFYQQRLQNYYPLKADAKNSASVTDFNAFFSPKGLLINFYQQYLSSPKMQNYLAMHPKIITLFSQVVLLKQWLYGAQDNLTISLNVYGHHMGLGIMQVDLMFAGIDLKLHPNALVSRTINWPAQSISGQSGYAIMSRQALPQTLQFYGDWSWLQLLQSFTWQANDTNTWLLTSKGQEFNLLLSSNVNLPKLTSTLSQLNINEKLFDGY